MKNTIKVLLCIPIFFSSCALIHETRQVQNTIIDEKFDNYKTINEKLTLNSQDSTLNILLTADRSKNRYEREIREMVHKEPRLFMGMFAGCGDSFGGFLVSFIGTMTFLPLDLVNPFPVLGFKKDYYDKKGDWVKKERIITSKNIGIPKETVHLSTATENVIINKTSLETNNLGIATTPFKVDNSFISQNNSLYNEESFETISPEFFNIQAQVDNLKASTDIGPYKNIGLYINQLASKIESKMNEKYFCRADFLVRDENNQKPLSGARVKIKLPSLKSQNKKLESCLRKEINNVVAKKSTWLKQELFKKMYQRLNHQITRNNEIKVASNGHFNLKVFKDVYNMVFVENNSFAKEKFDCTKSKIQYKILFSSTHSRLTIEQTNI